MNFFQPKPHQHFSDAERMIGRHAERFAVPLMTVDKNLVVSHANAAMVEMIASHSAEFDVAERVDAASLVGQQLAAVRDVIASSAGRAVKVATAIGAMKVEVAVHVDLDRKGQVAGYLLEWHDVTMAQSNEEMIAAIDRAQAMIEFMPNGKILAANATFLATVGYSRDEIVGQHHSMFVDAAHSQSQEYRAFWEKLGRGEFDAGRYLRYGKGGREIWLQANYSPVFDRNGKPYKVVKFASDITVQMQRSADLEGQLAAINKSQALIEFGLDGVILDANENFLKTLGYSLPEIKGQHHSMFVESAERQSPGYRAFWENLGRGVYDAGRYKRIGKHGNEIWIQASYNPIQDHHGKPFKVVKYATDITAQVKADELLKQAVQETRDVVEAAEGSDLSQRIPMEGKTGEIQLLCSGVNGLLDTMADVVRDISVSAREVANASGEVATATTDLSQRTEEQAASLEETSAAMDEISAAVKKNAENARHASDSAVATQDVASKGGEVVSHAVEAMARIEDSSRKIADIIGVIDEIARQTNLLALNAAVEAARAGDAGRGFAVVASEVRNLAQRSSQAAKDIKDLINNSTSQVRDGVSLVNQAGGQLKEIVDAIKQVAAIMSEIAHASNEQATGVDEVNKALTQMDEVTQQNSALVEENAATAKTLEQHAASMSTKVSAFRLGNDVDQAVEPMRMAAGGGRMMPSRPAPRPIVAPRAAGAVGANRRGPVGTMQTALANAVSNDDWKEF